MIRVKTSLDHKRIRRLIWLVLTVSVLSGYSLQSVAGSAYYSIVMQAYGTVSSPPVILEEGIAGSSTIYTNKTSAKVSAVAPAPIPTYYPDLYNISTGTHVSGTVPPSVQTVDTSYFIVRSSGTATSTTAYNPSNCGLLGSTTLVSGTVADLSLNNSVYMTFRSYASATSGQTLYAHQDTTAIGGTNYYLQKLASADAVGTSSSASMASTGRQLFGKSVYPLTGVSSIPASTWTLYYRAWRSSDPSIAYDAVGSGNNVGGSTSVSWSHTTGSGSNRMMIVGVSIRTTTVSVSGITYGAQSLTFIRADTHSGGFVRSELWYLIAPASGTATVTVTLSGTSRATGGSCTYTGVAQTSPIDANAGGSGKSGSPSQSITVNTANSWLLGHIAVTGSGKTITSEGSGQTMRWDQVTSGGAAADHNRGHGSDKGPVSTGSQSMSWGLSGSEDYAISVVAFKRASPAVGHADVDILIRQSNGSIRTTIASNVANSGDLASTASTLSGAYSWATYTVTNQTDYLEIDYYVEVTTALDGMLAYLRIDDNTLATTNQTRTTNVYLPSEFTSEAEFVGSSNNQPWYQLVWSVDSAWNTSSVSVTIQVYNYTSGGYPTSGNGYSSYTSSATANTDETKTQTITTNPSHFRNTTGYWKITVKGVKTTTTQFDFKADWVEFKPTYYSEYTVSTEFIFSGMTENTPTQLNFTVVTQYNTTGVNVTIQVWNYSSPGYVTSGEGYANYTYSGANETTTLSINTNPQFYTSGGNAKINVTGVSTTNSTYQQETNQIKVVYKYDASSTYDYVLAVTEQDALNWTINLKVYDSFNIAARALNTTISFHGATTSDQIIISGGNITKSEGDPYSLNSSSTIFIKMSNVNATSSGISYIYVYLKILVPETSTYSLYSITFEIT